MRTKPRFWLVVYALAFGFSSASFAQDNANKPLVALAGADSRIEKARFELITSKKAWTDLWLYHTGKPAEKEYDDFYNSADVPEINFEKCMVIAIFSGKAHNIAALEAVAYTETADQIRLRFREKTYQTAGADGGADKVTPFGLFVVSRSPKPLIVEEAVQNKSAPPDWNEVARFPKR